MSAHKPMTQYNKHMWSKCTTTAAQSACCHKWKTGQFWGFGCVYSPLQLQVHSLFFTPNPSLRSCICIGKDASLCKVAVSHKRQLWLHTSCNCAPSTGHLATSALAFIPPCASPGLIHWGPACTSACEAISSHVCWLVVCAIAYVMCLMTAICPVVVTVQVHSATP